jgi:tetratricopeptide (TPR) repeat protein
MALWIAPLAASSLQDGLAAGDAQNWTVRYNAGFDAIEKGRYSDAAEHFQSVIQNAEQFGRESNRLGMSLYGLGLSRYRQNEFAVAASLFGKSLAILERNLGSEHPDVVRILENLASAQQKAGDFADAERHYRQVLALRGAPSGLERESVLPAIEGFLSLLSKGSLKDLQLEGERRNFRRTIGAAALSKDLYGFMLGQLGPAELPEETESVMLSAVGVFPDSRQVRYDLAEMYVRSGKFEKALEAFKGALQAAGRPDSAEDRKQRSVIFRRIGKVNGTLFRFDAALSAYKAALELDPDSAETLTSLGEVYGWYEQLDNALAQYTRASAVGPETAALFAGIADANLRLGRFSESAAAAVKALERDPKNQRSRYVLAMALMRSNRREEGERVLSEYRRLEADESAQKTRLQEVTKLNRRVNVLLAKGQSQEAAALLREGVRLYPEANGLLLRLGQVVSKLGRHDEAAALLRSLIDSGTGDYLVHWIIASEYEMLGDTRAGQQHRVLSLQLISGALRPRTN